MGLQAARRAALFTSLHPSLSQNHLRPVIAYVHLTHPRSILCRHSGDPNIRNADWDTLPSCAATVDDELCTAGNNGIARAPPSSPTKRRETLMRFAGHTTRTSVPPTPRSLSTIFRRASLTMSSLTSAPQFAPTPVMSPCKSPIVTRCRPPRPRWWIQPGRVTLHRWEAEPPRADRNMKNRGTSTAPPMTDIGRPHKTHV